MSCVDHRQLASDPLLMDYDVLIMDEVHERHIHADFLLGLLRELIAKRPELKLGTYIIFIIFILCYLFN